MTVNKYLQALVLLSIFLVSCTVNKSIMLQTEEEYGFPEKVKEAQGNYKIRKNDYLNVHVYTNNGERLVDPNFEIGDGQTKGTSEALKPKYLVRDNGMVKLPMIGDIYLEGFTLFEADSILEQQYTSFYNEVFVITSLINRRVTILGPLGGKVIPLENEDVNLIEIIALYGGMPKDGKAHNIRLIRGDLNNPMVQIVDLSTIEGMKKASLQVEANDIVYIESRRRSLSEAIRDITPILGIASSILTIIVLLTRTAN